MSFSLNIANPRLWDTWVVVMARVLGTLLLAWLASRLATRLIRVFRSRITSRIADAEQARRAETLARVFRNLATVVISLLSVMLIMGELGIPVAPILGAASVVGLAVGFGAQSLVKDYVSGFFLLLENQVTKGDVVEVAGKSGTVEDVTLRFVQLRDYDGNVHYVPNGLITTVTNMSRGYAYAAVELGVAYGSDMNQVYAALNTVAQQLRADPLYGPRIEEPLEITGVEKVDGATVYLRCRLRVQVLEQWRVRREFLLRLTSEFQRQGISLPAPPLALAAR